MNNWKFFYVQINLGKCEWFWEEIPRCQIQDYQIQMADIPSGEKSLSQMAAIIKFESEWMSERQDNKVSESKMAVAESKMAEFKMAD